MTHNNGRTDEQSRRTRAEFIMYHIVNGSYFSQDLRDGQQLPSILDMRPIQVGVRVDGCSRKYHSQTCPFPLERVQIDCARPNFRLSGREWTQPLAINWRAGAKLNRANPLNLFLKSRAPQSSRSRDLRQRFALALTSLAIYDYGEATSERAISHLLQNL